MPERTPLEIINTAFGDIKEQAQDVVNDLEELGGRPHLLTLANYIVQTATACLEELENTP